MDSKMKNIMLNAHKMLAAAGVNPKHENIASIHWDAHAYLQAIRAILQYAYSVETYEVVVAEAVEYAESQKMHRGVLAALRAHPYK
jgi:hypothetical protein